jgi:Signal transduction histidine kinase
MKKRIFSNMLALIILSLLVCTIALCMVFYRQLSSTVQDEVRQRAEMLKEIITAENYDSLVLSDMRLTVVAPDGTVLYDDDQDASILPNHGDRAEISGALETGVGKSRRDSDTLREETFYYAVKLDNGLVLRLAKTMDSIWGMFGGALPVVLLIVLGMLGIGYFLAGSLTKRIVSPINEVDLEEKLTAPYDELAPFVLAISRQRERISGQIFDLKNHSDTVAAIMDSMSEGVILVDRRGAILSINKSASNIFAPESSVDGKNILEILRDVELNEAMRSALFGVRGEMDFRHGDKIYHVCLSPVTDSGAIILFLDVTEKSASEKLRREFSANVSHELKTPLTTIYGNVEMLESGMVKEADVTEFYGKIKNEAAHLITLIEDIIMLSQIDESSGDIGMEDVDLALAAAEVVESLALKAKNQSVKISLSGSGRLSANPSQMAELFYNLIENGIKYNQPGGTVKVEISVAQNQAKIVVADTGIGIPEESQGRVFERFYRVDKSRSKKTGGTGLGLAIVKHIAMAYGGNIELESHVGQGTTITISLNGMN